MRPINYPHLKAQPCPVCQSGDWKVVTRRTDGGSIVGCSACGHLYLNPTIPAGILQEIYETEYFDTGDDDALLRLLEEWFRDPDGPQQQAIRVLDARLPPGAAVCEVGCSVGRLLFELKRKGYRVKGIEPGRKGVELAGSRYGIALHHGFLAEPLPEGFRGAFDAVCAFEVIEHVHEPLTFARDCAALLKPGGLLFLSTPNFELFRALGARYTDLDRQEHIQYFTRETLSGLLKRAGFEMIEARTEKAANFGERLHARLAPSVRRTPLWQGVHNWPFIQRLKGIFIRALGCVRTPVDQTAAHGIYVFAVAKKL